MNTIFNIEKLDQDIANSKLRLQNAQFEYDTLLRMRETWEALPQNNIFESMDHAEGELTELFLDWASEACEGSHNRGLESYHRRFVVDGQLYDGTLDIEYNRHDKRYYFVDGYTWSVIHLGSFESSV